MHSNLGNFKTYFGPNFPLLALVVVVDVVVTLGALVVVVVNGIVLPVAVVLLAGLVVVVLGEVVRV